MDQKTRTKFLKYRSEITKIENRRERASVIPLIIGFFGGLGFIIGGIAWAVIAIFGMSGMSDIVQGCQVAMIFGGPACVFVYGALLGEGSKIKRLRRECEDATGYDPCDYDIS